MSYEPMYRKIYSEILGKIQDGRTRIGERLPSEKEYCEQYHVSRITVQKALEMLSNEGYVTRKPGKGTFAVSTIGSGPVGAVDPEENAPAHGTVKPTVGVIMDSFSASFGMELLSGLEYECQRRNFLTMVRITYGSMEKEKLAIEEMRAAGVRGIILMCVQGESFNPGVLKLYMEHFPLVLADREMKGLPIPVVTTDNYGACKEMTQEMIDAGFTRIGYLSHSSLQTSTVNERFEAFRDTMNANGLITDESTWLRNLDVLLPSDDDDPESREKATVDAIREYVSRNADINAYVVVEYGLAAVLYRVLREMGLEKRKTIGCFDGIWTVMDPSALFVHVMQGQYEMGTTAVRLLAHLIRGENVTGRVNVPYQILHAGEEPALSMFS